MNDFKTTKLQNASIFITEKLLPDLTVIKLVIQTFIFYFYFIIMMDTTNQTLILH